MKADWVSFDEALALVYGGVSRLPSETRELDEALGYVLARDLVSPIDLPPWTMRRIGLPHTVQGSPCRS